MNRRLLRAPGALLLLALAVVPLAAQKREQLTAAADFFKEPDGTLLGHLLVGTNLLGGASKGSWREVTIDAWVPATALREDTRDGFEFSISVAAGATLRTALTGGSTVGTAKFGALFHRVETRSGWVHVRRTAWIPAAALAPVKAPPPAAVATPPAPAPRPASDTGAVTMLTGGTVISATPTGSALATFETPVKAEVLEHRSGWAHVRIEGWVRDGSLGEAPPPGSITAADIRAQPDRYVGQTVEWTLQVIAVQKADELRPELPTGQPYVLARGPLPESGFVYMVITSEQESTFRGLQPLSKIRVRATVRAGRSKYLPVPVLTFVRRLD